MHGGDAREGRRSHRRTARRRGREEADRRRALHDPQRVSRAARDVRGAGHSGDDRVLDRGHSERAPPRNGHVLPFRGAGGTGAALAAGRPLARRQRCDRPRDLPRGLGARDRRRFRQRGSAASDRQGHRIARSPSFSSASSAASSRSAFSACSSDRRCWPWPTTWFRSGSRPGRTLESRPCSPDGPGPRAGGSAPGRLGLRQQGARRHRGPRLPHAHRRPRRPAAATRRPEGPLQRRGPRAAALLRLGRPSSRFLRRREDDQPSPRWPRPLTDQPDAAFRRQFSDAGQCFHFMARLEDAEPADIEGTSIPRGLATTALVRCRDFLDNLMRQVVLDGGPGVRKGGYGLYELMHAVDDSFSGSHTQRVPGTEAIEELRIWKPLTRLPGLSNEKIARIPDSAFHKWDDHRDKIYVVEERVTADGRRCKDLTGFPYSVPYECLSETGDHARQAIVELLIVVRDLRVAHKAASAEAGNSPHAGAGAVRRLASLQGPLVPGRLCLPGRRVPGAAAHRPLSRLVRLPRPRHDLQHHPKVPRRHGQGNALPVQLGLEPVRLRAVRRGRFPPLRHRGGRRPGWPRGGPRAPDRTAPRAGIHSRGLARRVRRRPHRIGSHDELLPRRLRHRQPLRSHAPRSPGDRLAQARRRALHGNRCELGPDLAQVRRQLVDRASHRKGRAGG